MRGHGGPAKRNNVDHDDIEIFRNMEGIVLKRGDLGPILVIILMKCVEVNI